MTSYNPNLDLVHIKAYKKFGQILSICSEYILTSIKGSNSVIYEQKMTGNNANLDLVNINAYIKFSEILLIHSQDIERIRKCEFNQEP